MHPGVHKGRHLLENIHSMIQQCSVTHHRYHNRSPNIPDIYQYIPIITVYTVILIKQRHTRCESKHRATNVLFFTKTYLYI